MLGNENYKNCTFFSDIKGDYITLIFSKYINVYNDNKFILQCDISDLDINGAVYLEGTLYCTQNYDNIIYVYKLNSLKDKIILHEYENIKIIKCINSTKYWFVLQIDARQIIAYDLINKRSLFLLPIQNNYIDIALFENENAIMVGDDVEYELDDVGDSYNHTLLCSFHYNILNGDVQILDQLEVHTFIDNWDDRHINTTISKYNMKFPLFDMYLYYWLEELSISAHGKYIIYYSNDIKGIIISEFENGTVYQLFVLPKKYTKDSKYYFNELTNIFTIVNNGIIERYIIKQESEDALKELNKRYNDAYKNKKNVQEDDDFKSLFFQCLIGGKCKKMDFEFDVALSFAGEDREYVDVIANRLKNNGIKVFYDKFEVSNLWGKDLYQYLSHIYKDNAKYCVIFISDSYKNKTWTRHELRNAQNRAFLENKEYILPVFLENVELDGLNDTIGYIKASEFSESEVADLIIEKVNKI